MLDPKITVLLPAFNAEKYIGEAISSVLAQDMNAFELLIINDGSTDSTANIIKNFTDPRVHVITQQNQGIAAALNNGLSFAKGKYIARFDADDICLPGRLNKQAAFLDTNPAHVVVGCEAEYMDETGNHLFDFACVGYSNEEIKSRLKVECPFIHSGVMYRKAEVLKAGGYSPLAHNFEDYLLWVQLAKFGQFANLPEKLIKVRLNPESVTIDEKWRGSRFRKLKKQIITKESINKEEGDELLKIINSQDIMRYKLGAYYSVCGKKYLFNNHKPAKSRSHFKKAILVQPAKLESYILYMLSFLPGRFVDWVYHLNH